MHLLLTDVVMPGMSARELLSTRPRRCAPASGPLHVRLHRGRARAPGRTRDGVHLIGKPFTVEALTCKVREVLDQDS